MARHSAGGFLLTELVVALGIVAVLIGAIAYTLRQHRAVSSQLLGRGQAFAAAEAQLLRLRLGQRSADR